jgi:hypothetical protein
MYLPHSIDYIRVVMKKLFETNNSQELLWRTARSFFSVLTKKNYKMVPALIDAALK